MNIRPIITSMLALLIGCSSGPVGAEQPPAPPATVNDHVWDCWISSDLRPGVVDYRVRCIADREIAPANPPPDSPQAVLLDLVHDAIHRGEIVQLDRDLAHGRFAEVSTYIRQIPLHQYPYAESWEQGRPRQLVEAILCPGRDECAVLLFR